MSITGTSTSRLIELRKYTISGSMSDQYFLSSDVANDGVDMSLSIPNVSTVYYIGEIKYIDYLSGELSGITQTFYTPDGTGSTLNFTNTNYYKHPDKNNIVSQPKIEVDVFIDRSEISAFENNYRLEEIDKLNDLITYAGGNYFNIVKNS